MRTVGAQSDLYEKHAEKKIATQQLDTNETFQIMPIDHDTNDNLVQIKGAGDNGLYLFAHSNSIDLGCLNEYSSEDQTTFFELTQGADEGSWFIEAVFNNFDSNSRFLSQQKAQMDRGEVNAMISLESIDEMRVYSKLNNDKTYQWEIGCSEKQPAPEQELI